MENTDQRNNLSPYDPTKANYHTESILDRITHGVDDGYYSITNSHTGQVLKYKIPDSIPEDPSWTVLGNIEMQGRHINGDPYLNVLAHKVDNNGRHRWALGWEPVSPIARETCKGWGFENGYYYISEDYIPLAYVIGLLLGLEEIRYSPQTRAHAAMGIKPTVAYSVNNTIFNIKPKWRFRGQKTWLRMEPASVIFQLRKDLDRRFVRQRLFESNFDLQAIGWFYQRSNTLYVSEKIGQDSLERLTRAAWQLSTGRLHVTMVGDNARHSIPPFSTVLLVFNTDRENIVAVSTAAKPKDMTWAKLIEIVRLTRVWPVDPDSLLGPVFPLKVINIETNTVDNL